MRKRTAPDHIALGGFFVDRHGDMTWAHQPDNFAAENGSGGALVFGRITDQTMARFWPMPQAAEARRPVAAQMNQLPKFVFSRTLAEASWKHTGLMKEDIAAAMRGSKQKSGPDVAILGSRSTVSPFASVSVQLPLHHLRGRTFAPGNALVTREFRDDH